MDERVREFIETVLQTIIGLDVALFYQANPSTFDTPSGIALRTHRGVDEVRPALERLAEGGILERHERSEGRYVCYALSRDRAVWDLLCKTSEVFLDDPSSRKEIVKLIMAIQAQHRIARKQDTAGGEPA